jgi:hypothetical protein
VRLRDVGEHRWGEPEPAIREVARRGPPGRALGLPGIGQRSNPVQLRGGVDRASTIILSRRCDARTNSSRKKSV